MKFIILQKKNFLFVIFLSFITFLNPSKSIKTKHLHLSNIRNYNRKTTVPKPYLLIKTHFLNETPINRIIR
jgi:hypothetical protein